MSRSDWRESAACAGMNCELFYPVGRHETNDPVWDEPRDMCFDCPVRFECVNDAIDRGDAWGMRGGLTPAQLSRIVNRPCRDCGSVPAPTGHNYCTECQAKRPTPLARAIDKECVACGQMRLIKARGLCSHCWRVDMEAKAAEAVAGGAA